MTSKFALILIAVALSAQTVKEEAAKLYQNTEAYEVYAAILSMEKPQNDLLLINDTTTSFSGCLESHSDKLVDSAIKNYKKSNVAKWQLEYHFPIKSSYKLLSERELDALLHQDVATGAWPLSPEHSVHRFSAVGFNADKTIAFVEMDVICGGLCGHGQSYILQKRDGKWQEYSGQKPKVIKRIKLKDGSYQETLKGPMLTICGWYY